MSQIQRNKFDLSFDVKDTFGFRELMPILCQELVPGDNFKVNAEIFLRVAPMLAPVMHRVNVYTHYFFVPNRLLMRGNDWETFITRANEGTMVSDDDAPILPFYGVIDVHPTMNDEIAGSLWGSSRFINISEAVSSGANTYNSFLAYNKIFGSRGIAKGLGFPAIDDAFMSVINSSVYGSAIGGTPQIPVGQRIGDSPYIMPAALFQREFNVMPFAAYQLIYDEYYRDQNLEPSVFKSQWQKCRNWSDFFSLTAEHTVADQIKTLTTKRYRAYERDYFTSSLPFPQKHEDLDIPVGGLFPVMSVSQEWSESTLRALTSTPTGLIPAPLLRFGDYSINETNDSWDLGAYRNAASETYQLGTGDSADAPSASDRMIFTNLAAQVDATDTSINDLRLAFQLQRYYEKLARTGSRYIEWLNAQFGTSPTDARLQRPEFLGGGKQEWTINEVLQTSQSSDDSQLGEFAGHGIVSGHKNGCQVTAYEHGFLIGLISVMPRTSYQNGRKRFLDKRDWTEFYLPAFDHLGEQPTRMSELIDAYTLGSEDISSTSVDPEDIASIEFGYVPRYAEYRTNYNEVRGDFAQRLSYWHLGRDFASNLQDGQTISLPAQIGTTVPLNEDFIRPIPQYGVISGVPINSIQEIPENRIFPSSLEQDINYLWAHIYFNIDAYRPMSVMGEPGFADHN